MKLFSVILHKTPTESKINKNPREMSYDWLARQIGTSPVQNDGRFSPLSIAVHRKIINSFLVTTNPYDASADSIIVNQIFGCYPENVLTTKARIWQSGSRLFKVHFDILRSQMRTLLIQDMLNLLEQSCLNIGQENNARIRLVRTFGIEFNVGFTGPVITCDGATEELKELLSNHHLCNLYKMKEKPTWSDTRNFADEPDSMIAEFKANKHFNPDDQSSHNHIQIKDLLLSTGNHMKLLNWQLDKSVSKTQELVPILRFDGLYQRIKIEFNLERLSG